VFRYRSGGKDRHHGIGSYPLVSLATARQRAVELRRGLLVGVDPITEKQALRAAATASSAPTFQQLAEAYLSDHEKSWSNPVHRAQWRSTLTAYAFPVIATVPVADVSTDHVLSIVKPIWTSKTETANRVRGRIEAILDAARAAGHRAGDNPARWAVLKHFLPPRARVAPVRHMPALAYKDVPAFMLELRARAGVSALALQFVILTCCRTGEAIGATWSEIDGDVWNLPAERMKMRRPHRQPLSDTAVAVLEKLPRVNGCEYLFPGSRLGQPISNMAMLQLLRDMRPGLSVHGFRASFKSWATEQTTHPREVIELALAHRVGDAVERAYMRGDNFGKRAQLMADWADYVCGPAIVHPPSEAFSRVLEQQI
jgi:integrase